MHSKFIIAVAMVAWAAASGTSYAGWTAADDVIVDGTANWDGAAGNCTCNPNSFGGMAQSTYDYTRAYEWGFPWICGEINAFSYRAEALGATWTKRWNWAGCPIPADESTMDITAKMSWRLDGNCNNYWLTAAYAKTYAHAQIVVNSAPDNAGDYTGEGEWSGEKREGDTWSGGLSLDWDMDGPGGGTSLSWSSDPTDVWLCGLTTKSTRYLQNIKNKPGDAYDYIYVEIGLLCEAEAAADTNACHAVAEAECWVDSFTLSEPE